MHRPRKDAAVSRTDTVGIHDRIRSGLPPMDLVSFEEGKASIGCEFPCQPVCGYRQQKAVRGNCPNLRRKGCQKLRLPSIVLALEQLLAVRLLLSNGTARQLLKLRTTHGKPVHRIGFTGCSLEYATCHRHSYSLSVNQFNRSVVIPDAGPADSSPKKDGHGRPSFLGSWAPRSKSRTQKGFLRMINRYKK